MKYAQYHCSKCEKRTPHRTKGAKSRERDEESRVTQLMQCVYCKTTRELLIDPDTGLGGPKPE